MDNLNSIRNMFSKLNTILNPKQKMGALCLFCVLIVGSVLELLGVTLVLPFVQAIVTPEQLAGRSDVLWIMSAFHVESTQDMVMIFAVLLVLVYFVKNAILIGVTYIQYDYATKIQMELGNRMLRAYVKRPYLFFTKVDSSEIIRGCSDDIVSVYWIIAYLTDFVSQCVVASVIGCYLIYTDPLIAITVILLMLLQILCITYFFKPATKRNGEIKLRASTIQKNLLSNVWAESKRL